MVINGFVTAIMDPAAYANQHPEGGAMLGDYDGDGFARTIDIDLFVADIVDANIPE